MQSNPIYSRCPSCSGVGRTTEGYCNCARAETSKGSNRVRQRRKRRARSEVGARLVLLFTLKFPPPTKSSDAVQLIELRGFWGLPRGLCILRQAQPITDHSHI